MDECLNWIAPEINKRNEDLENQYLKIQWDFYVHMWVVSIILHGEVLADGIEKTMPLALCKTFLKLKGVEI